MTLKLRKKIIDQAIEDLSKGGLGSVTIPAISQELGVKDFGIFNISSREEEKILKDFKNMLNLHLQDRLFF